MGRKFNLLLVTDVGIAKPDYAVLQPELADRGNIVRSILIKIEALDVCADIAAILDDRNSILCKHLSISDGVYFDCYKILFANHGVQY
ncbi:hypothetical protein D9M68_903810 [compost metagenome]